MRSRASEARTVSTSASSGIFVSLPGRARGFALGALLRTAFALSDEVPHANRGVERHRVRGTLGADLVMRRSVSVGLSPLTQSSLRIDITRGQRGFHDVAGECGVNKLFGGVVAAFEIESRDDRLKGVGEQRRALGAVFLAHATPHA